MTRNEARREYARHADEPRHYDLTATLIWLVVLIACTTFWLVLIRAALTALGG